MKKLLSILSTISLSTIISTNIIACKTTNTNNKNNKPIKQKFILQQPQKNSNWQLLTDKYIQRDTGWYIIFYKWFGEFNIIKVDSSKEFFNFVENSWWNKKNHQYDNLKTNFV